jgi:hypothetical protein
MCVLASQGWASGCEDYLNEAEARSGVVPRFTADGLVSGIFTHGEASLSAPTASLVATARRDAELDAKRGLSEWLSMDVSAETLSQTVIEEATITNQSGDTQGAITEFARVIDTMRSQTEATLRGVVKLDECVDPQMGLVLVTMGWKPAFLEAVEPPASNVDTSAANSRTQGGSITFVKITVEGFGQSQTDAINDGLRLAVSQVFGEQFSSEMSTAGIMLSVETTDVDGTSAGLVVEQRASTSAIQSTTSGLINSYRVRDKKSRGPEVHVTLEVELPKYQSVDNDSRIKVVVLPPIALDQTISTNSFRRVSGVIQREIEGLVNETNQLSVLDQSNTAALDAELRRMSGPAYSVAEFARFGNRLGADYLLITELGQFSETQSSKILAGKRVERITLQSTAWIKIIDVGTGNMVFSQGIPMNVSMMKRPDTLEIFASRHAHALALSVAATVGGGLSPAAEARIAALRETVNTYSEAAERIAADRQAIRDKAAKDW